MFCLWRPNINRTVWLIDNQTGGIRLTEGRGIWRTIVDNSDGDGEDDDRDGVRSSDGVSGSDGDRDIVWRQQRR